MQLRRMVDGLFRVAEGGTVYGTTCTMGWFVALGGVGVDECWFFYVELLA